MSYLHIGGDTMVPEEDIIAILDLDNSSTSSHTRDYLRRVQREDKVISVTEELPRSVVVCLHEGGERAYLSLLSSATLFKRAEADSFAGENYLDKNGGKT